MTNDWCIKSVSFVMSCGEDIKFPMLLYTPIFYSDMCSKDIKQIIHEVVLI